MSVIVLKCFIFACIIKYLIKDNTAENTSTRHNAGNNRWMTERCTKRRGKRTKNNKKTFYLDIYLIDLCQLLVA